MTGAGWRLDRRANSSSSATPVPSTPTTRPPPHPHSWPFTIPSDTSATPATSSPTPTASGIWPGFGSRDSRSRRRAGTSAGRPIARLTKKTQRQPAASTSTPPRDGPTAAAMAPIAPQMPVAVARCCSVNSGSRSASDVGTSAAAPTAWTTRATTRTSTVGARPAATEAARNVTIPAMNVRRRPVRSASRPAGTRSAANTMLYALKIQERSDSDVSGNHARMSGNAMFTIVTSRKLMKTATDVTASTCHLRCMMKRTVPNLRFVMQPSSDTLPRTPMLPRTYDDQNCSVARALEVLGDRWTLLVIRDAFLGVRRFDDFQRDLGVARNVLSDRLQRLTDEGLLERRRYQERPERFEYRLTEKGIDLWPAIVTLMKWGDRYYAPPEGAPRVVRHRECGGEVTGHLTCETCGASLTARDVYSEPGPGAPTPPLATSV